MLTMDLARPNEHQTRLSLFLGIMLWFFHMNLLNALISVSCNWGWFTWPIGGLSGLQFVEAIVSFIILLLMLFMVYLPWRNWRSFQAEPPVSNPRMLYDTEEDKRPFMAFIAMLLNSFFLLFLIATFVPMFTLNACGQV